MTIARTRLTFRLIEIFYILSFFSLTYTYNINIVFSLILIPLLVTERNYKSVILLVLLILLLSAPYLIIHDARTSYRVIKTLSVFLPLLFLGSLKKLSFRLDSFFDGFMFINAAVVYIDFFLFFAIGRTIGHFTTTGIMPRPCGLIEDSNFYSYLMLIYIFYRKFAYGKLNKFLLFSILLSGSVSATFASIILILFYRNRHDFRFNWKKWGLCASLVFTIYIIILFNASNIINFIQSLDVHEFVKLKLTSMILRLTVQSDAIQHIIQQGLILGVGSGKTVELLGKGINLHNGYLQLFFEMGPILFIPCVFLIIICFKNLGHKFFIPIFFTVLLLGQMLEVIYFPLLSFILFISYTSPYKQSNSEIRHLFCNNLYGR